MTNSFFFLCCWICVIIVNCDQVNVTTNLKSIAIRNRQRPKLPMKKYVSKDKLHTTYGNLILAEHLVNGNFGRPKPGDVLSETVVISPTLNLTDPTVNSTHKNIVDWFLGAVGLKPDIENPSSPSSPGPNLNCAKCTCGLALKHKRIVGGVETLVNEYPWMVALRYNNRFYCGASLINNKYILTAAHCVNGFTTDRLSAVFLDHDRSNSYETTTFTRRIQSVLRHRNYGQGGNYNNDIALLRLDQEVSLNDMVRPVCLPPTGRSFTGQNGIAVGWGATAEHGQVSTKLREVTVPIMSNADCKKTGYNNRITDNMICAGFPDGKKDSCQGDSGGPLHVINGTSHEVVGVVSWGEGCAQPNYPGVYTRVNRYVTWIMSNTRDACYC